MQRFVIIVFSLFFLTGSILAENNTPESPRIGLALSGGGAKGFAHIGVIKVLEEIGLEVDFITGTSMGAIIGGLYSIGYDSKSLEHIAFNQDWEKLFSDASTRRDLSLSEKGQADKFIGGFSVVKGKINLPAGLLAGQHASAALSRLTWPVHHVEDFDDFQIPFRCVATDIENGKAVVLGNGYLPDAILASMSIPSLFVPVKINNRLLVDGGLVRNLPASDARDMGADIVIGVDVSAPLFSREELSSLVVIMNQTVAFQMVSSTKEQIKNCDIFIRPNIEEYNTMDFAETDSLIARGEMAARAVLPQLKEIVESLKKSKKTYSRPATTIPDLSIEQIKVEGLRKVSKDLVLGKLNIIPPQKITPEELEEAIDRVYGTKFFERISYQLDPTESGTRLILHVIESPAERLNFGLNYTSKHDAGILFNETTRNVFGHGSKLIFDVRLGDDREFGVSYEYFTNIISGLGLNLDVRAKDYDFFLHEDLTSIADYDFTNYTIDGTILASVSNSAAIGFKLERQKTELSPNIVPLFWSQEDSERDYFSQIAFMHVDTFDDPDFPKIGSCFYGEAKRFSKLNQEGTKAFYRIFANYKQTVSLSPRNTMLLNFVSGHIHGDSSTQDQQFYFGGYHFYENYMFAFTGFDFMQVPAKNVAIAKISLQSEFEGSQFVILEANVGKGEDHFENIIEQDGILLGYGAAYGFKTPIGPVKLWFCSNNKDKDFKSYLTIGHWF